jgi:phosphate/sulfate permease
MLPEHYYLGVVILLFILAITDLVVGVSNDAVNFLNSSIGARVASRRVIMIIAGLGIFAGALFSSGMMEIARKGIFVPDYFSFQDVMIVFLAVMLTDILLLDLFNTFGMPTSTTVSIVFELLGASVVVAAIKIWFGEAAGDNLLMYINTEKAVAIISSIFLSILFAFSLGTIVQYLTRLVFSFHIYTTKPLTRILFFAGCFSAISYFLMFKGLSGASFIQSGWVTYVQEHLLQFTLSACLIWMITGTILNAIGVNLFRVIVLFGTFSLAMSFAGNDLVNFIGVSVAGLESFNLWVNSGEEASLYLMEALGRPIQTNTPVLMAAGLVMVLTLWFSKKAQSVTETEVKLARQNDGDERFQSNRLANMLVQAFQTGNRIMVNILPKAWMSHIDERFSMLESEGDPADRPAFDLVRASINLTLASLLISLATSFKLPLSTTYVSFMVAMGSSLADRAWNSNSAAQRISGVLNVVGGWFLTALIAFSAAGLFALLIHFGKGVAVALLTAGVFYSIYRTFRLHQVKAAKPG